MVTDPYASPSRAYNHKLNFNFTYPSRWWFLRMFLCGKHGGLYWRTGKGDGVLVYVEKKEEE
jgi:hypothetical protein